MSFYYLDFEQPLKEIDLKILELESDVNVDRSSDELTSLTSQRDELLKDIYSKLTCLLYTSDAADE